MCLNHPDPQSLKTLDEVIAALAIPSCNTSSFINKICKAVIDTPDSAGRRKMIALLATAPESQLAPIWTARIKELDRS